MAAGTAVTPQDRPSGHIQTFNFTLAPGAITTGSFEAETVAIPGLLTTDAVHINVPPAGLQAGLAVAMVRVSAAGVVSFNITNSSGGTLTPTAGVWTLVVMRGSTMAISR